jgi:hypothetical protein
MDIFYNVAHFYTYVGSTRTMNYELSKTDMIKLMDKCIKKNKSIDEIYPPLKDVMY